MSCDMFEMNPAVDDIRFRVNIKVYIIHIFIRLIVLRHSKVINANKAFLVVAKENTRSVVRIFC